MNELPTKEQLFARTLIELAEKGYINKEYCKEGELIVRAGFIRNLQFNEDGFEGFLKFALDNKKGFPVDISVSQENSLNSESYLLFDEQKLINLTLDEETRVRINKIKVVKLEDRKIVK